MPATVTCPRCDAVEPATNRLCSTCGHDLRTPVLETLDPPSTPRHWRSSLRQIPAVVPLVISLAALALGGTALAMTALQPNLEGCRNQLWDRAAQRSGAPDGWMIHNHTPLDTGWTAFLEQPQPSGGFSAGAFVSVSCTPNPARQLAAVRAWAPDDRGVDFPTFGDETFAVAGDPFRGGGIQVWWRQDRVIGQVQWYGEQEDDAALRTIVAFLTEWTR